MWRRISWQSCIVICQKSIGHFEHLINECTYLLVASVSNSDQHVGTGETESEQFTTVLVFLLV